MTRNITPSQLILRVSVYYVVFIGAVLVLAFWKPESLGFMPFGGLDAIDHADVEITENSLSIKRELLDTSRAIASPGNALATALFLLITLVSTILVMIPITWAYSATRFEAGPSKTFVRALILMPICAATVVLLIQDSLALAFGLAAIVTAVRFRVSLRATIDGIYIFAAICVGLAAGIGYLGIALVMGLVFSLAAATMWRIDYGSNPMDDAQQQAAVEKLARKLERAGAEQSSEERGHSA